MSQKIEITAQRRTDVGKGASRRLRRAAKRLPGIIYGGTEPAQPITLDANELFKAMQFESFFSQILTLKTDGALQPAVVRDIQRNPANEKVTHIDFQRINVSEEIDLSVPLHFINEDVCVGVKVGGGTILHRTAEVEVRCLPGNLPEYVEVDLAEIGLGQSVHLSDLTLPEGVQVVALTYGPDHDQVVATVQAARVEVEAEEAAAPAPAAADEKSGED